jgi:hypothetical protein
MKLYISGPMTGYADFNKPAFFAAEKQLRAAGHEVVNPVNNGIPDDAPWESHLKADIKELMDCDGVAFLPNSQESRGARLEMAIAKALNMPVQAYARWL